MPSSSLHRLAAAALICALPATACAEGAIAYGTNGLLSDYGVAVGLSYNYDTSQLAKDKALDECRHFPDSGEGTREACKIAATFSNQCIAVALDPDVTTEGFGWAVGANSSEANQRALDMCRVADGAATGCAISATRCDGSAS